MQKKKGHPEKKGKKRTNKWEKTTQKKVTGNNLAVAKISNFQRINSFYALQKSVCMVEILKS